MRKIIELTHRIDDYVCMWNGVEDLYIHDTGEKLPPKFFFVLSSFGSFCYMKTPKAELKRMLHWVMGEHGKCMNFLRLSLDFIIKYMNTNPLKKRLQKSRKRLMQAIHV